MPDNGEATGKRLMMQQSLRILLLCDNLARHTGTTEDHVSAFKQFSQHNVAILDVVAAAGMRIDLNHFDAIVFHYSVVVSNRMHFPQKFCADIARFAGAKILFIQDEFRWVDDTCAAIEAMGITTIFTLVSPEQRRQVYRTPWFEHVRFEPTLTGYVSEHLAKRQVPDYADRAIDVSYRARKLPAWCGSFAQMKWQIGERFRADGELRGLSCDIEMSEDSRIYGEAWFNFIANSKACLGTESGASFVDYTGKVAPAVDAYASMHPSATFAELRNRFLEDRDGDVLIRALSPRLFEAAALRTLLIMYPGEYSGCAKPGRHYVLLEPDHSNMDEVVAILRDCDQAGEIIQNAYREIACAPTWTYRRFIEGFDRVALEEVTQRSRDHVPKPARETTQRLIIELERQAETRTRKRKMIFGFARFVYGLLQGGARAVAVLLPERLARSAIHWVRVHSLGIRSFFKRILIGGR